jgi:hypothetical protein
MKLYVDLDLRKLVLVPGWGSPVTELTARRGEVQPLEVYFVEDGFVVDPGTISALRVTVKTAAQYSEDPPLTLTTSFTESGSGLTTVNTGLLDLTGAGVAALVGSAASGAAMLEVSWTLGTDIGATPMVPLTIQNSVYHAGDAAPVEHPSQGTAIYLPGVTDLVGGGATNLDGLITAGVSAPKVYILTITTGGYLTQQVWALVTGTDAAVAGTIVRPTDYNASTNAKVLKRIS